MARRSIKKTSISNTQNGKLGSPLGAVEIKKKTTQLATSSTPNWASYQEHIERWGSKKTQLATSNKQIKLAHPLKAHINCAEENSRKPYDRVHAIMIVFNPSVFKPL